MTTKTKTSPGNGGRFSGAGAAPVAAAAPPPSSAPPLACNAPYPAPLPDVPKVIAAAVQSSTLKIYTLLRNGTADEQKHKRGQGFSQIVSDVTITEGLTFHMDEVGVQPVRLRQHGRDQPGLLFTFAFYLGHRDGKVWPVPLRRSVSIKNDGIFTAEFAAMNALIAIQRTLFQVHFFKNDSAMPTQTVLALVNDMAAEVLELKSQGELEIWRVKNADIIENTIDTKGRIRLDEVVNSQRIKINAQKKRRPSTGTAKSTAKN